MHSIHPHSYIPATLTILKECPLQKPHQHWLYCQSRSAIKYAEFLLQLGKSWDLMKSFPHMQLQGCAYKDGPSSVVEHLIPLQRFQVQSLASQGWDGKDLCLKPWKVFACWWARWTNRLIQYKAIFLYSSTFTLLLHKSGRRLADCSLKQHYCQIRIRGSNSLPQVIAPCLAAFKQTMGRFQAMMTT